MTNLMRDPALNEVKRALVTIGYDQRAIVPDYDFAVPGDANALGQVDMAAFSDPVRHDLYTSCIAVHRVRGAENVQHKLQELTYLASPVALFLQTDSVDIWPVTRTLQPQPLASVEYDRLYSYFAERARDFQPAVLAAAKSTGRQLGFFDLDRSLLQFAYETTQQFLVERFEAAVTAARQSLAGREGQATGDLTKAALQILAAAILEDKKLLGSGESHTVEDLIRRSATMYGQYFDVNVLHKIGRDVGQIAFESLRQNLTFRSFTNEMLGYFYENAFVDKELRKELGVYYTPQSIAKRILSKLPVEEIPPSDRVVFDGSSGSGNLLLAAFERIGDLLPNGWDRDQRHEYLVQRIHGVDVDQFATQVAGLSLFFIDLPAGDAWDVSSADFMDSSPISFPRPPTIVIGNPPFKETRSANGRREQRASLFLNKYLDLLSAGGLLGVVLPETFLENSSCREARNRLLNECEILELWHLPEGIFPMSRVATVVAIARKHGAIGDRPDAPVRIERVGSLSDERTLFLEAGRLRFSYVVPSTRPWSQDRNFIVSSSPLQKSVWDAIRVPRKLGDVASIRNGIIPGSAQRADHIFNTKPNEDAKPWIGKATSVRPYSLDPSGTGFVTYPGDLERPRLKLQRIFESPNAKVLVNSGRAPGNPWRICAAIDEVGYFPSQGFYCVTPRDESVSLEELVAVLNSSVASAWVDNLNRRRWIGKDTLQQMPFPTFSETVRDEIRSMVNQIMDLKKRELTRPSGHASAVNAIRELSLSIERLVHDAFGIGDDGRAMMHSLFAGHPRPGPEWDQSDRQMRNAAPDTDGRTWAVTGQVIQIDAGDNSVTLWVRGYNDSQPFSIPIPETMPGWALRSQTPFEAEIPWDLRASNEIAADYLTNFRPLDFSYSEPEKLLDLLDNPEKVNDFYGC